MDKVTVVLPAYNEEKAIGKVIDEIRALPIECKILVGDNTSSDGTYNVVKNKGITPVRVREKGKGNVVRALLKYVETPYVITVDADYTYPIGNHLMSICSALGGRDVVICYRRWKERNSMSLTNSIGNYLLSLLASILYGYKVRDFNSGLWGFKKEALDKFKLTSKGFTLEADFFTNAIKHKCKMWQIPIRYRARLDGSKPKLKIWDGFKIAWFLLHRRFDALP